MKLPFFLLLLAFVFVSSIHAGQSADAVVDGRSMTETTPATHPDKPPPDDAPKEKPPPEETTSTTTSTLAAFVSETGEETGDSESYNLAASSASTTTKTTSSSNAVDSNNSGLTVYDQTSRTQSKAPFIGVVGALTAAASLMAAAVIRRRRVENESAKHPLKGSVQKRMNLFAVLADPKNTSPGATRSREVKLESIV